MIDFYTPREPDPEVPAPLVVVLRRRRLARPVRPRIRHVTPFADFLARRGFAVADVEYRRGAAEIPRRAAEPGRGPLAEHLDVAAALDALPALAREHLPRADLRRTVIAGHSAGGHLACGPPRAPRPARRRSFGAPTAPPAGGVVALAPIADFTVAELERLLRRLPQLLGGGAGGSRSGSRTPTRRSCSTGIATTLVQGRTDVIVPEAVAESYAEAAARAGEVVGLTLLEDVGHFPLIDPAADACAVVAEEIADWLGSAPRSYPLS